MTAPSTTALRSMPVITGRVFDASQKVSREQYRALYAAGFRTVIRYCPLPDNGAGWDLDAAELADATAEGMTVVVVQHPRAPANNMLSEATGAGDAAHAIAYCRSVGYATPANDAAVTLALDMEGVRNPGGAFAHARRWVIDVVAAGYRALVYIGFASGLTSAQLDELAALGAVFWLDAAPMPTRQEPQELRPLPKCGYVLHQMPQTTIAGVGLDEDRLLTPGAIVGLAAVPANDTAPEDVEPHPDVQGTHAA
jgi:hypothetical protein